MRLRPSVQKLTAYEKQVQDAFARSLSDLAPTNS
jgi:hypothetical protein